MRRQRRAVAGRALVTRRIGQAATGAGGAVPRSPAMCGVNGGRPVSWRARARAGAVRRGVREHVEQRASMRSGVGGAGVVGARPVVEHGARASEQRPGARVWRRQRRCRVPAAAWRGGCARVRPRRGVGA